MIKGFTLTEALVTMVIVGILTAVAYPSYSSYLQKSRRSDALAALAQDQIILERCHAQNFSYGAPCTALPTFPQTSAQGFYSISLTNVGAATYTLTARPRGAQTKDTTCAGFSVNQANQKTAVNSSGISQNNCWNPKA